MSQPDFRAKAIIEASVSPSEDPGKVAEALRNVAGGHVETESSDAVSIRMVTGDPRAFLHLKEQLRDRHIRSAARRQLLLNRREEETSLMLNRQAAAAGVVALCGSPEESPLGPIYLTFVSGRVGAVVEWLSAYPEG